MFATLLFAVAAPALASKPIRHLEYRVHASITHDAGLGLAADGYDGVIVMDVVGVAEDAGLVVRASETMSDGSVTHSLCAVYGTGRTFCDAHNIATVSMNALLQLLGRHFYDPSQVDAKGGWSQVLSSDKLTITSRYQVLPSSDAKHVRIDSHTDVRGKTGTYNRLWDEARIVYDPQMSIPLQVHDEIAEGARFGGGDNEHSSLKRTTVDLQLMTDSFANIVMPSPSPSP